MIDQLTKKAPSIADETKEIDCEDITQYAALSDAIWAQYYKVTQPQQASNYTTAIQPAGKDKDYWIYGKDEGGVKSVAYSDVANHFMNTVHNPNGRYTMFEQNNIQSRGFLLLKDRSCKYVC